MVLSECSCPGRELRLQCTVVGSGNTLWKGTAFDCNTPSNEIVLRHFQFVSGVAGTCNNGMIVGRSLNRTVDGPNSTFTSQLVIRLPLLNATNSSESLDGRTIECIYDNGTHVTNVGTHVIAYTRAGIVVIVSSQAPPNFSENLIERSLRMRPHEHYYGTKSIILMHIQLHLLIMFT